MIFGSLNTAALRTQHSRGGGDIHYQDIRVSGIQVPVRQVTGFFLLFVCFFLQHGNLNAVQRGLKGTGALSRSLRLSCAMGDVIVAQKHQFCERQKKNMG